MRLSQKIQIVTRGVIFDNVLDGIHSAWRACDYDVVYDADDCDGDEVDFDDVVSDDEADWQDLASDDDDSGISNCVWEKQRNLLVAYLKGIPRRYLGRVKYRLSSGRYPEPVFCMEDPEE